MREGMRQKTDVWTSSEEAGEVGASSAQLVTLGVMKIWLETREE